MEPEQLPEYTKDDFALVDGPECDLIMKGGITSGIVYPYALLEIATKYRFRSVGGTSAGAIAASFAAAAEFARKNGRPEGFLLLKQYCDELPEKLLSLFQPSPEMNPAVDAAKEAIRLGSLMSIFLSAVKRGMVSGTLLALVVSFLSYSFAPEIYPTILAALLAFILGGATGIYFWGSNTFWKPIKGAISKLPKNGYGFCTGLTQEGSDQLAVTDWIHNALQDIAFGNPKHKKPLTFGDLAGTGKAKAIDLQVVTTNLSMRRPHNLPRLGVQAGYLPAEWRRLFPASVMTYLKRASGKWAELKGSQIFPNEDGLPVIVAVRMSLSFPILFESVPVKIVDTELTSVIQGLGGAAENKVRNVLFSDGGISSNFPVHMFDRWLPERPTFAFSLEDLRGDASQLKTRVRIPVTASEGMGVQIDEISSVKDFAWQILNSAKDWQDQLLSEISGQRERVARIYLTGDEGGMNLDMKPDVSRKLMQYGLEAGRKFNSGGFNFDEHKWRRLLVIYKHLQINMHAMDEIWKGGFSSWYADYLQHPKSYRNFSKTHRLALAKDIEAILKHYRDNDTSIPIDKMDRLPKRIGALKIGPRY